MIRIKPLALLLALFFPLASLTLASTSDTVTQTVEIDEATAAGWEMMRQNSSLLRNGDNMWQRIREGFQLTEVNLKLIRHYERLYGAHPEKFRKLLSRSHQYLFHIVNEVERRGLPTELALLPIIESAFIPTAKSRAGASGLWQFMPITGRQYGLEQTWWYDGRRDVIAATRAALDYLEYLYNQFGDWNLALAAYNWGEGNLSRAIARAQVSRQGIHYETLRLPNETRHYSPKLLAVRNLLAQPEKFGITLAPLPNKPYFIAISPGRHMNLSIAAEFAAMSLNEFKALNPAFNLPVFAHKPGRQMLIPASRIAAFEANLNNWDKPLLTWQVYTPSTNESIALVANKVGMTTNELLTLNNLRTNIRLAGRPLLVARKESIDPLNKENFDSSLPIDDTLFPMTQNARRRPAVVTATKSERAAPLSATVTPATKYTILAADTRTTNRQKWTTSTEYVVRHGDTVSSIAHRFGIDHHDIVRWNGTAMVTPLQPGQRVKIQGL